MPPAKSVVVEVASAAVSKDVLSSGESLNGTLVIDRGVDVVAEGAAKMAAEPGAEVGMEVDVGIGFGDVTDVEEVERLDATDADTR